MNDGVTRASTLQLVATKTFQLTSVPDPVKIRTEDPTHFSKVSELGPENTLERGLREKGKFFMFL